MVEQRPPDALSIVVPSSPHGASPSSDDADLFEHILNGLSTPTGLQSAAGIDQPDLLDSLGLSWESPPTDGASKTWSASMSESPAASPRAVEPSIVPMVPKRQFRPTPKTTNTVKRNRSEQQRAPPPPKRRRVRDVGLLPDTANLGPEEQLRVARALRSGGRTIEEAAAADVDDDDDFRPGDAGDSLGASRRGSKRDKRPDARVKKREAVRNCRKRKREEEERLTDKCAELEEENARLRRLLRMGDTQEQSAYTSYEAYAEANVFSRSDRLSAVEYLLERTRKTLTPDDRTRLYLWLGTCPSKLFLRTDGLWKSIRDYVGVTPEQQLKFRKRKVQLLATNVSVQASFDALSTFLERDGVPISDFESLVDSVLDCDQKNALVQLVEFVRKSPNEENEKLKRILDAPYFEFVSLVCPSGQSNKQNVIMPPLAVETPSTDLAQERTSNARTVARLLSSTPFDSLVRKASGVCAPNVVLMEPVNLHQKHTVKGVREVCNFAKRLRLAFEEDSFRAEEKEMIVTANGSSRRTTWLLTGTYCGRLKTSSDPNPRVSFVVVATASFKKESSLIEELVISWDVLGLMRQIGLLGQLSKEFQQHNKRAASDESSGGADDEYDDKKQLDTPEGLLAARHESLKNLKELFETAATVTQTCLTQDATFLDSNMGGTFRSARACCDYIRKMRRPFPWMRIEKVEAVEHTDRKFRVTWSVRAAYGGKLNKSAMATPPSCAINATLFVTFDREKISFVEMSWDAKSLLEQLGLA